MDHDGSICFSRECGAAIDGITTECPVCGGPAASMREMRLRGYGLTICGLTLIGSAAMGVWYVLGWMYWPEENGIEVDALPGMALLALAGLIGAFGITGTRMALHMVDTGRIDFAARGFMMKLVSVFVALGIAAEIADALL